jgi:hypothetical protein
LALRGNGEYLRELAKELKKDKIITKNNSDKTDLNSWCIELNHIHETIKKCKSTTTNHIKRSFMIDID